MSRLTTRRWRAARRLPRRAFQMLEDRRLMATIGNNIGVGNQLQNYRIAIAATAEYTAFFGGVAQAYQAINTFVDDLNQLFEAEFSIHLDLVSGTNVVYTNAASDPYTNGSPATLLSENQANLDAVIGTANYDVGHVFGTLSSGGSGIAGLGVVGRNGSKARGASSFASPVGDNWLELAGHEIAHQFGAAHTFNGVVGNCANNRSANSAYEPGSGTTLMSYAGICGSDNVQPSEDAYFHANSFEEVQEYIDRFSYSRPRSYTPTGNAIPTVDAGPNYTIPARSFFELTAAGADADAGQPLSYTWEQIDLGPAQALGSPDNGASPLFRSYPPDSNPARSFPRYDAILAGTSPAGETLPTTNRTLNFRATVRDGHGGVNSDDVRLTVVDTGAAFRLTSLNSPVNLSGGSSQPITWNVAGTHANGINSSNVEFRLSTDGGHTFPLLLATTANDGSHSLQLPNIDAPQARLRIQGAGNVFFDVSDATFTITANPGLPGVALLPTGGSTVVEEGGAYDSYQIALRTTPSGPVSIEIAAAADVEISLDGIHFGSTQAVTLDSTAPRTVFVRGIDDPAEEGPETSSLVHTIVASGDGNYPLSLPLNALAVVVVDDELPPVVGLDFDCCSSQSPAHWSQTTFFGDQFNMPRDDGQATSIDLDFTGFGSFSASTVGPASGTIPRHIPGLVDLDGHTASTGTVRAVYSGLTPGREYGVFVFGFERRSGTYVQNVTISGAATLPMFTQSLVDGSLHVNDQLGDSSRTLASFQHLVAADANGRIEVLIAPGSGSSGVSLAGLALREMPLPPPVAAAAVVERQIFYNNSAFDGNNPSANASDDHAVALDKRPLLPGNPASFANYTSYVRGINGIMIDIAGLANPAQVDAADFTFRTGRTNSPSNWELAPPPASVTVRAGEGVNGSDRIVLIWNDGLLTNTWLEITTRAGGDLGLAANDVFYFGNAIGETGNSAGNAQVNATDFSGVRNNPHAFLNPAAVDDAFDFNRDRRVNSADLLAVRDHATPAVNALPLITPAAAALLDQAIAQMSGELEEPFAMEPVADDERPLPTNASDENLPTNLEPLPKPERTSYRQLLGERAQLSRHDIGAVGCLGLHSLPHDDSLEELIASALWGGQA